MRQFAKCSAATSFARSRRAGRADTTDADGRRGAFGALLGWIGVALTGSDTSSNVLFGGLQVDSAQQVGVDPKLMAAATCARGEEGSILRRVFWHSVALACLIGLWVLLQAWTGFAVPAK